MFLLSHPEEELETQKVVGNVFSVKNIASVLVLPPHNIENREERRGGSNGGEVSKQCGRAVVFHPTVELVVSQYIVHGLESQNNFKCGSNNF